MNAIVISIDAAADLSSYKYYPVKMTATGINICADGEYAIGVLQDKPAALGRAGAVCIVGESFVIAGAVVAKGAELAPDATGRAITALSADESFGTALEAAGAAGDQIRIIVQKRSGLTG